LNQAATITSARSIRNLKSAIKNIPETPNGGQGVKRPDRFFAKSGYFFHQIYWE
jgi:hypothetical protein